MLIYLLFTRGLLSYNLHTINPPFKITLCWRFRQRRTAVCPLPRPRRGTRHHRQGLRGRPRACPWPLAVTAVLSPECHTNGTAYCVGFGVRFLHAARGTWDSPASWAGWVACLFPAESYLTVWPHQACGPARWETLALCTVWGDYEWGHKHLHIGFCVDVFISSHFFDFFNDFTDIEYLRTFTALHISSLVPYLFKSRACFHSVIFLLLSHERPLCSLETNVLSDVCFTGIFSESLICLFMFLSIF